VEVVAERFEDPEGKKEAENGTRLIFPINPDPVRGV
jgi:hypothetical protein